MPSVRVISKAEAQQTQRAKEPGVRRQRMSQFDEYARVLIENPAEAVVYEELGEHPQKFVLSLRGAFKRAGAPAVVRKMRGRDEVRVWFEERQAAPPAAPARRGRSRRAAS
jgi:hypothetical protein